MRIKVAIATLAVFLLSGISAPHRADAKKPNPFNRSIFAEVVSYLTDAERKALRLYRAGKTIQAKELAYKILQKNPSSFVAHYLIFYSLQYDDGLLMRALYHLRIAMALFKQRFRRQTSFSHQIMLVELIFLLRQLGWEREAIKKIDLHDRLYPRFPLRDLKPWALMKLRKYRQARELALKLLYQKRFVISAYNALCAIEFEQNRRLSSIKYCQKALEYHLRKKNRLGTAVHYYNLGEAYLTVFDFARAERSIIKATEFFHPSTTTDPWDVLVGLYLDQGRFADAWRALRQSKIWFLRKEPRLSESSYAGNQLTIATFLSAVAMPDLAMIPLDRIRDRPDRMGYSSIDVKQLVGAYHLLLSHNLRLKIQTELETASVKSLTGRIKTHLKTAYLRFLEWRTRAQLRKLLLSKPDAIVKALSPYRSGSLTLPNNPLPNWMIADLGKTLGPAVALKYLEYVRANELKLFEEQCPPQTCQKKFPNKKREFFSKLEPFLTALQAEFLYQMGEIPAAAARAKKALLSLNPALKIQKLRLRAISGLSAWLRGDLREMLHHFSSILQTDGSVFRRMEIAIPIAISADGSKIAAELRDALYRSPRFRALAGGYQLQLSASQNSIAFILREQGNIIKAGRISFKKEKSFQKKLEKAAKFIHDKLFSPPIDLTAQDIYSLDGTPYQRDDKDRFLPEK